MKTKDLKRFQRLRKEKMSLRERLDDTELFTDEEIFTSVKVKKYVASKLKYLFDDFGMGMPMLKLNYVPSFNIPALTDNKNIIINTAHRLFNGTRTERLEKVLGAAAHEASHCIFTNFAGRSVYLDNIMDGRIYPRFPKFENERESAAVLSANANALVDFLEGKTGLTKSRNPAFSNREWLSRMASWMLNILEDGRIEYIFSNLCYMHRGLNQGLAKIASAQAHDCYSFDELIEKTRSSDPSEMLHKIEAIYSMCLHYIRNGEIKGYRHEEHKKSELTKMFRKITPYLDSYIEAMSIDECLDACNKIIITLWPYYEELIEKINNDYSEDALSEGLAGSLADSRRACFPGQTEDTKGDDKGEGTDSEEFNNARSGINKNPSMREKALGEKNPEKHGPSKNPSEVKSNPENQKKSSESTSEVKEPSEDPSKSEKPHAGDNPENQDLPCAGSSGGADLPGDNSLGENASEVEESSDCEADAGEDAPTPPCSDINEDFSEEELRRSIRPSAGTSEEKEREPAKLLDEIESELARENEKKVNNRNVKAFNEMLDTAIDYGSIHDGVRADIIRREVSEDNIRMYEASKSKIDRLVNRMLKKSEFLKDEPEDILVRNKYSGRRFNANATAKGDYKYFSREIRIEPAYNLDVIILVDESGSMSGERIEAAKTAAICCYDFMRKALGDGHVSIYGHTTSGMDVRLRAYADFDVPDEDDKYRIMQITACGSNRDGYALRFVKEKISLRDSERKLIITISDGQPAHNHYGGEPAVADIRQVLREAERENIMYIAAAIGDDKEVIKSIYGEKHFLDLSDLGMLPDRLMNLIGRLLK